jgi:hypothetical protein
MGTNLVSSCPGVRRGSLFSAMISRGNAGSPRGLLTPLMKALAISLMIHLVFFATWKTGLISAIVPARRSQIPLRRPQASEPPVLVVQQPPVQNRLAFSEVDPQLEVKTEPKDARFFAAVNTEASSRIPKAGTDLPNIHGKDEKVVKTTPTKLEERQPSKPELKSESKTVENPPMEKPPVGDLALRKPLPDATDAAKQKTIEEPGQQHRRPLTLAQADSGSQGVQSKMEGGAKMEGLESLAAKGRIAGRYFPQMFDAIGHHWRSFDSRFSPLAPGRVILGFQLHHDGRISDMTVLKTTVGEVPTLICQKAVLDPAPYPKWENEMRRELGSDQQNITIEFSYGQ